MTQELGPYTAELAQVKEGIADRISLLSNQVAASKQPGRLTATFDGVMKRLIPGYKDTQARAQFALKQAEKRLQTAEAITVLGIQAQPGSGWHAEIHTAQLGFVLYLTRKIRTPIIRHGMVFDDFEARRDSLHISPPEARDYGKKYGWIVASVLQRHYNRNLQVENQAQKPLTTVF